MSDPIDLSTFDRPKVEDIPRPRRRWVGVLVPLAVVLAFGGILLWSADDLLQTPREVSVVRARPADAVARTEGAVVLQAAGWIEPDPAPVTVAALAPGVIDEVLVQESDRVEAGQPVAHLIAVDARLELDRARAATSIVEAECRAAEIAVQQAERAHAHPLALDEAVVLARAEVATAEADERERLAAVVTAEARLAVASIGVEVQRFLEERDAAGPFERAEAEGRLALERARRAELRAGQARILARRSAAEARLVAARQARELQLTSTAAIEKARADLAMAEARRDRIRAEEALAALRLSRMTVRAPVAGVVLRRDAAKGTAIGPELHSEPILQLYDPSALRLRVDVPQTRISEVRVGQAVAIEAPTRRDARYPGRVVRIVREANIQKVTLQVHVAIEDPDERLAPEMLCTARFLSDGTDGTRSAAPRGRVWLLPASAIREGTVWVLAPGGRSVLRRSVTVGERRDDLVEVLDGLDPSSRVVVQPADDLEEGDAVRVREEAR